MQGDGPVFPACHQPLLIISSAPPVLLWSGMVILITLSFKTPRAGFPAVFMYWLKSPHCLPAKGPGLLHGYGVTPSFSNPSMFSLNGLTLPMACLCAKRSCNATKK